jgi:hypothetical protein
VRRLKANTSQLAGCVLALMATASAPRATTFVARTAAAPHCDAGISLALISPDGAR